MSEDNTIEEMRHELGKDSAQKGDPLHKGASEEFVRGYSSWNGSSNVMPRHFGKGRSPREPWVCLCGHHNPRYIQKNCWQCGVPKSLVDEANATEA